MQLPFAATTALRKQLAEYNDVTGPATVPVDLHLLQQAMREFDSVARSLGFGSDRLPISPTRSIFVTTLPKSGSVFIESVLRAISGNAHLILGTGYFPNDTLLADRVRLFAKGGFIAQQHTDASPNNIALLEKHVGRWIIHIRDPRSVVLSWTHHLETLTENLVEFAAPIPPPDYTNKPFAERLDWQIENFYPVVVRWIESWLDYANVNPQRVEITSFEAMARDEYAFFSDLLSILNLDGEPQKDLETFKTPENHYRVGRTDEWKDVCTKQQIERMPVPSHILSRIGGGQA